MSNVKSRMLSIFLAVLLCLGCFVMTSENVSAASPPGKPSISATKNGWNSVKVTWNAAKWAKSYEVYMCGGPFGSKFKYKTTKGKDSRSATISRLYPGSTYKFKVKAINGNKSTWSDAKSVKISLSTPKVTAKAMGNGKVKITVTGNGYTDCDVYMSTKKSSGFKQKGWMLNLDPNAKTHTTVLSPSFTGKSYDLVKGKTYYFKVKGEYSNNMANTSTPYSSVVSCKVK